ncbi:hypothetical protein [Propionivibrio dicarboxylicus]|uniref:Tetratricopeptide repeat-containing protein n=1 Tax=Propionivibrio dicarboxylicus TaxID=83767 RepID=A0A1G8NL25_9RHOO|nr:hypothetical protein [Propionivibrio dicarboxylicus]SDI80878.1 hypothetical protein SAMN05660652_04071 [Propionivibrio dicarboxylicus]
MNLPLDDSCGETPEIKRCQVLAKQAAADEYRGELDAAIEKYRMIADILLSVVARDAEYTRYLEELSRCYWRSGEIEDGLGRPLAAADCYRRSIGFGQRLSIAQPDNRKYTLALVERCDKLAAFLAHGGDSGEAIHWFSRGTKILRRFAWNSDEGRQFADSLKFRYWRLEESERSIGRVNEAFYWRRQFDEICKKFSSFAE